MNIKFRLTFIFTFLVTLILIVFSVTVYKFYAIYREANYSVRLKEKTFFNAKLILDNEHSSNNPFLPNKQFTFNQLEEQSFCIYNIRNEEVGCIGSPINVGENKINFIRRLREFETISNDTQYIGIELKHKTGEYIVISSGFDVSGFNKLKLLYRLILVMLSGSILISGFAGWWFATVSLRPMQEVMKEVDEISVTNLHKRVRNRNSKDEIDQLVNTFNQMLTRIENSFILEKTLVANASHEYRTPLTAMKGQIEVALLQPRKNEDYLTLIKSVHEEINRIIRLQESLSELIKASGQQSQTRKNTFPLLEIIADARATLLKSKTDYKISLEVNDLPANQEQGMVIGDDALLESVFSNLMDNACKFSSNKTAAVSIEYKPREIITTISDKGVGISEQDMANIFTPFFRSNEVRDVYGHGLGLALVKRIVEIHEGQISVESTVGKGTTFKVTFQNITEAPLYSNPFAT